MKNCEQLRKTLTKEEDDKVVAALNRMGAMPFVGFCNGANMGLVQAQLVVETFKAGSVIDLASCERVERFEVRIFRVRL